MRSKILRSCSVSRANRSSSGVGSRKRFRTRPVTAGSSNDSPSATRFTAFTNSFPRICFKTYPDAPAMIASNNASSSLYDVSIKQNTSGNSLRTSRHTSTPLPSGNRTSRIATLGWHALIRGSASEARPASPTTLTSPLASRSDLTPCRTTSWSSSKKTGTGVVIGEVCPNSQR